MWTTIVTVRSRYIHQREIVTKSGRIGRRTQVLAVDDSVPYAFAGNTRTRHQR